MIKYKMTVHSIDPLEFLFNHTKPQIQNVKEFVFGSRQIAVLLENNQLGSCATLGLPLTANISCLQSPNFNNLSHRALLIAYYNANFNYCHNVNGNFDIFDIINFTNYKNLVMIGYFRSLTEKLDALNIPLHIFDLENNDDRLTDINLQPEILGKANALIITATTLLNNTFTGICSKIADNADVFLLGPSSILCNILLNEFKLKYIFGTVYNQPEAVMQIIKNGGGIKDFSPLMQKIYIKL
jgi:uncharacterized protein (DUF4213/DUF364 family)